MSTPHRLTRIGELGPIPTALLYDAWKTPWDSLSSLEIVPGIAIEEDVWRIPPEWRGRGTRKQLGLATIDYRDIVPSGWHVTSERVQSAIRRAKRIAILMNLRSIKMGGAIIAPTTPSTWVSDVSRMLGAVRWVC